MGQKVFKMRVITTGKNLGMKARTFLSTVVITGRKARTFLSTVVITLSLPYCELAKTIPLRLHKVVCMYNFLVPSNADVQKS